MDVKWLLIIVNQLFIDENKIYWKNLSRHIFFT